MSESLRKRPGLLIISDTMMIETAEGVIAFEPVVRELENFPEIFGPITWIGFGYPIEEKQYSVRSCGNSDVTYIMLPRVGGHRPIDKLRILFTMPYAFGVILKQLLRHNVVHTRAPSMPAFLGILLSLVFRSKTYWHKFAGNWGQINPPKSYGLQRWLLKRATHTRVTVNGKWPDQESHVLSFENPCIDDAEYEQAKAIASQKRFDAPFDFCFVGRLEDPKGVQSILDVFKDLDKSKIGTLHFIGDGKKMPEYRAQAETIDCDIVFHGFLSRAEIDAIYTRSHFLLLPSTASEGFPKVIAEAAAFGCIPVVSNVSSIPQYINDVNGFVIADVTSEKLFLQIKMILQLSSQDLRQKAMQSIQIAVPFTYVHYNRRIEHEILECLQS